MNSLKSMYIAHLQRLDEQGIPRQLKITNYSDPASPNYGKPNSFKKYDT